MIEMEDGVELGRKVGFEGVGHSFRLRAVDDPNGPLQPGHHQVADDVVVLAEIEMESFHTRTRD